jgi:DNA polymerase III gamma/tau subunit
MNRFLFRLSLAAALTFGVVALGTSASAQQPSSQDPAATTPPDQQAPSANPSDQTPSASSPSTSSPQEPTARPQQEPNEPAANQQQNEPNMPAAGSEAQTQDAKAFSGRIMKENGKVVLKDPVTKTSYQLDDASKVKAYMGKQVKVTGKLDVSSNTIRIDSVEPLS